MPDDAQGQLLDRPSRDSLLFCLLHRNETLFLRRYFTDDLPEGALPSARQVHAWQDKSTKRGFFTGRKVMKTTYIESMIIRLGLCNTEGRRDWLYTTPAENMMTPTLDRVEQKLFSIPLFKAMVKKYDKGSGVLQFESGFWWYFRIEGVDGSGRNMVGLRAHGIIGDEQSFGSQKAHDARGQVARDPANTPWLYAGVPNGVRLTPFWKIDQDRNYGRSWSVHRMTAFENPVMATPEGRQALIDTYGSEEETEYKNNVLGEWGEERSATFPAAHVDGSLSDTQPYRIIEISDTLGLQLAQERGVSSIPWAELLEPIGVTAAMVGKNAGLSVMGLDHGFSPDPTVITIAYLDLFGTDHSGGDEVWRVLGRIVLRRILAPEQALAIDTLRSLLNLHLGGPLLGLCADMSNYGLATFSDHLFIEERYDTSWYQSHCLPAAFGSTEKDTDDYGEARADKDGRVITKRRKQVSTELLKDAFAANVRDLARSTEYLS